MTDRVTVKTVYNALSQYIRDRADIGLNKAVSINVSNRRTHLTREATRPPRRWFVLFCLVSALSVRLFQLFQRPTVALRVWTTKPMPTT